MEEQCTILLPNLSKVLVKKRANVSKDHGQFSLPPRLLNVDIQLHFDYKATRKQKRRSTRTSFPKCTTFNICWRVDNVDIYI